MAIHCSCATQLPGSSERAPTRPAGSAPRRAPGKTQPSSDKPAADDAAADDAAAAPRDDGRAGPNAPLATVGDVPVFFGRGPGHPADSNPAIFLGKSLQPNKSYRVTGLYRPQLEGRWSGYPDRHPALEAAGAGNAMTPPNVGMGYIPLTAPLQPEANAIVTALVEPVVQQDEHGNDLVLFAPREVQTTRSTAAARKIAAAFHRQHHQRLRSVEERRLQSGKPATRASLPPFSGPPTLRARYHVDSRSLSFEASSGQPLGVTWTVNYVFKPPYAAVSAVHLSSLFMGE